MSEMPAEVPDDRLVRLARNVSDRLALRSAVWDGNRQVERRGPILEIAQEREIAGHGAWKHQVRFEDDEARPGIYLGTLTPEPFRLAAEKVIRLAAVFGGVCVGGDPVRSGEGSCRLFETVPICDEPSTLEQVVNAVLRWEQLTIGVRDALCAVEAVGGLADDPRRPKHGDRITIDAFLRLPHHLAAGCEVINGVVWREDRLGAS